MINEYEVDRKNNLALMERMLEKQVEEEVHAAITELVMPKVEKIIKEVTANAVAKWATNIHTQKTMGMLDTTTEIQVVFVEEVVKTVSVENPISITVKGKK